MCHQTAKSIGSSRVDPSQKEKEKNSTNLEHSHENQHILNQKNSSPNSLNHLSFATQIFRLEIESPSRSQETSGKNLLIEALVRDHDEDATFLLPREDVDSPRRQQQHQQGKDITPFLKTNAVFPQQRPRLAQLSPGYLPSGQGFVVFNFSALLRD